MGGSEYYPYEPSKAGASIVMLLFGGSAFYHLWQFVQMRTWFFTAFLIGASSMFIILPPSLYAATIYMTYSRILVFIGKPQLSIVAPSKVTKIFVLGDTTAFLLQLGGGGMQPIDSMRNIGQKVLLMGLFVQLLFFGFFLYVLVSFQVRLRRSGFDLIGGPWRRFVHVLFLVSALIICRCVFWIIEYIAGTDSYIYIHEVYMYIFDAIPMFLVQAIFHFYHPGNILAGQKLPDDADVNIQSL